MHRRLLGSSSALLLAALFVAAGCGSSLPNKRVHGKVTLDGAPVAKGVISLAPLESGPSAAGEIIDGQYDIGPAQGPAPGQYKVSISAMTGTGKQEKDPDTGETWEVMRESIPERYNSRTELIMEVKADGDNEFDYALSSKPQ
jgi:hypothetical protein